MIQLGKRIASQLPSGVQQEFHRLLCGLKIRTGRFTHYEPEYHRLAEWVKGGDIVLDIGANLGIYSARLSELVGPQGQVFAFEPVPRTFQVLSSNSRLFRHKNVTLLNLAASDTASFVELDIPVFENGIQAYTRAGISNGNGASVGGMKASAFSVVVDSLAIPGSVSFVKIDVEGHELSVLKGMEQTLRKDSPVLVIEGEDEPVVSFLSSLGYGREKIDGSPNSIYQKAAE